MRMKSLCASVSLWFGFLSEVIVIDYFKLLKKGRKKGGTLMRNNNITLKLAINGEAVCL